MKEIDITSIIGCSNMCYYCPQKILLKNYNSHIKILTLNNLKIFLKNINKNNTIINFSGFSENLNNNYISDILLYCYNQGFTLNYFYTTLNSINDLNKIIDKLKNNVEFNYVIFHEYDGLSFNKELFNKRIDLFKNNIKSKNYIISKINKPLSRAGNNENISTIYKSDKIKCNFYNLNHIFNCNVLLPNGDLYLCCNDFGLKHKIGNLFHNHYESDEFYKKRKEIQELLLIKDSNVICRLCEFSEYI
jgi:radical SAM protein with 4Fe4S-binding SPASM domain